MKTNKKVVLITGCSSGIGYQTALTFARQGYQTFASLRDVKSEGALLLKQIAQKEHLDLFIVPIDVTRDESVKKGVKTVMEKADRIDILVNNAGIMYLGAIETFTIDKIKAQFETNYFGAIRMIKAVAPLMRKQQSGLIINVSSINGLISAPLYGIYSSSKFALETMSEALRFELAHFGIRVALVEPGIFKTRFWENGRYLPETPKNNPYGQLYTFFTRVDKKQRIKENRFISHLIDPSRVANKIYEIAQVKNPQLRHIVGYDANLIFALRKTLPDSVWFWLLHKVYRW